MKDSKVVAQIRNAQGSGAAQRLRRQGVLPAVVYNNKGKVRSIQLNLHDFSMLLHHHASENVLLDLVVDNDESTKVLLKEVQHHPVTSEIIHADFQEISMTEKIRVQLPLEVVGEAIGVKEGGVLEHTLRYVEVECLPGDLVEKIEADITNLKLNDTFTVKDLIVPPTMTILSAKHLAVASVVLMKVEEEATAEAAVASTEAGAEPEVITKGKEKEEKEPEK